MLDQVGPLHLPQLNTISVIVIPHLSKQQQSCIGLSKACTLLMVPSLPTLFSAEPLGTFPGEGAWFVVTSTGSGSRKPCRCVAPLFSLGLPLCEMG